MRDRGVNVATQNQGLHCIGDWGNIGKDSSFNYVDIMHLLTH